MGACVVRTSSLNYKHSCQHFRKAASFSSLVLLSSSASMATLSYLLATTFSSLRFLFNFTSLQSFESGQALFLVVFYFLIFASYPQPFIPLLFVCEALFALSFSFLSERLFFVMLKLLWRVVEINNTGVQVNFYRPKLTLSMRMVHVIPQFDIRQTHNYIYI